MIFNKNLIKHYEGSKFQLAKYVLFSIYEDIQLNSAITNRLEINSIDIKLSWAEDVLGDVQEIIMDLLVKNIIEANNYENVNTRYRLLRPLYVHSLREIDLSKEFIAECRSYFFKHYCERMDRNSSKKLVRELLIKLIEFNDIEDISIIPKALKLMVDERMKQNPDFVTKLSTFIDPLGEEDLDGKNLMYYIEECQQGGGESLKQGFDI